MTKPTAKNEPIKNKTKMNSEEPGLSPRRKGMKMVIAAGLEPATYCLEGNCSIQLSYATNTGIMDTLDIYRYLEEAQSSKSISKFQDR
jgi:hypothetical protein